MKSGQIRSDQKVSKNMDSRVRLTMIDMYPECRERVRRLRRSEVSGKRLTVEVDSCFRKPLISIVTWEWVVEGQWRPVMSLMKKLIPAK